MPNSFFTIYREHGTKPVAIVEVFVFTILHVYKKKLQSVIYRDFAYKENIKNTYSIIQGPFTVQSRETNFVYFNYILCYIWQNYS